MEVSREPVDGLLDTAIQLLADGAEAARVLRELLVASVRATGAAGAVVYGRRGTDVVELAIHGTVDPCLRATASEVLGTGAPVQRSDPVQRLNAAAVPVVAAGHLVASLGVCGPADRLDARAITAPANLVGLCLSRAGTVPGAADVVGAVIPVATAGDRTAVVMAAIEALAALGLAASFACLEEGGRLRVARYQGLERDRVTALVSSPEFLAHVAAPKTQPAIVCPAGEPSVLTCAPLGPDRTVGMLVAVVDHDDASAASGVVARVAEHAANGLAHADLIDEVAHLRRRLEAVLHASPTPALLLDPEGSLTGINPPASELLGLSSDFDAGHDVRGRLGGPAVGGLIGGEALGEVEVHLGTPPRTYRAIVAPIRSHEARLGTALFFEDVSARQEHEQARDDFTSVIGHELRTPLTVIKGFLETVLARGDDLSTDERSDCLGTALGQTQRLEVLVNDLLFLTTERPKAGVAADQCDVLTIASAVVQRTLARHPDRELSCLALAGDGTAQVDRRLVTHALGHLVDNAVKYSEGPVRVEVAADESAVEVAVVDQGPGIFSGDLERVFKPFEQLDSSSTRRHGGTGLGLYVTRALVEAMGGRLECDSRMGQGSRFSFRLPKRLAGSGPVDTALARDDARS